MKFKLFIRFNETRPTRKPNGKGFDFVPDGTYEIAIEGNELGWTLFKSKNWDTIKTQRDYFVKLFGYTEIVELRSQPKKGA